MIYGSPRNHHKTRSITEDEGFVEVYSQEATPSYQDTSQKPSSGLINFADARKQQIKQKVLKYNKNYFAFKKRPVLYGMHYALILQNQ